MYVAVAAALILLLLLQVRTTTASLTIVPYHKTGCVDEVQLELQQAGPTNVTVKYMDARGLLHVHLTESKCRMSSGVLCFGLPQVFSVPYMNKVVEVNVSDTSLAVGNVSYYDSLRDPVLCRDSPCSASCEQNCSAVRDLSGEHDCDGEFRKTEVFGYLVQTPRQIAEYRSLFFSAKVLKVVWGPRYTCTELEYFMPEGARLTHISNEMFTRSICKRSTSVDADTSMQRTVMCTANKSYVRPLYMNGTFRGQDFTKTLNYSSAEETSASWNVAYRGNACDFFHKACSSCRQRCVDLLRKETSDRVLCDGNVRNAADTFGSADTFPLDVVIHHTLSYEDRICIVFGKVEFALGKFWQKLRMYSTEVAFMFVSGESPTRGRTCGSRVMPGVTICARKRTAQDEGERVSGEFHFRLRKDLTVSANLTFGLGNVTRDEDCPLCETCDLPLFDKPVSSSATYTYTTALTMTSRNGVDRACRFTQLLLICCCLLCYLTK